MKVEPLTKPSPKDSEFRYRRLFEAAQDGILILVVARLCASRLCGTRCVRTVRIAKRGTKRRYANTFNHFRERTSIRMWDLCSCG